MRKHPVRIIIVIIATILIYQMFENESRACNVAVISASASATGRPFIWKNRDHAPSYRHQVLYYPEVTSGVGGSLRLMGETVIDTDVAVCTGGVNESGFAIANTTCVDTDNDPYDMYNVNTDFMVKALEDCRTLAQFEALAAQFTTLWKNKNISGIFAVIDAYGGAAIYEMWTNGNGNKIMYNKFDAVNNTITSVNGAPSTIKTDSSGLYTQTQNLGFINRTNSNHTSGWIDIWSDDPRELRARQLLMSMKATNTLTPRNMMRLVSKDVLGGNTADYCTTSNVQNNWDWSIDSWDDPNYDGELFTRYAISRYQTSMGLVIEGAASPEQASLTTMWVSLGEPSLSVFVPFFPYAESVSKYATDDEHSNSGYFWDGESDTENNEDNCFLNLLFDCVQSNPFSSTNYPELNNIFKNISLYDNNGSGVGSGSYDASSVRYTGSLAQRMGDYMDNTINYPRLLNLQKWTLPLENSVFDSTEDFISVLEANPALINRERFADFSDYCNMFVYANYSHQSYTYLGWTHELPDDGYVPSLLGTIPAVDGVDFPVTGSITVQFSEPIDNTTIDNDSFKLFAGNREIAGTIQYNHSTMSATLTPDDDLSYDTEYMVVLTSGITDLSGKQLSGYSWNFHTVSIYNPDLPPSVTGTSTGEDGEDFPVAGNITVQFSEAMLGSSITTDSFIVYAGDTRVGGTVTYNESTHTATFNPTGNLAFGTTYTVELTPDIVDASGTAISQYTWTFTTVSSSGGDDPEDPSDPDDPTDPVNVKSYSGGGCGFSAAASTGNGGMDDLLPGMISLLTTMLFPLGLMLIHRARTRRHSTRIAG